MKLASLAIFFVLVSTAAFAGPFGLDMGMSLAQVRDACGGRDPVKISDDRYYAIPQKPHPQFTIYVVWIGQTEGLYYIKAVSADIQTSVYGTALRTKFDEIERSLSRVYGKSDVNDYLRSKSIWSEPNDWMRALEKEERVLFASWDREHESKLPEALDSISLFAQATSSESGFLSIEYEFTNHEKATQKLKEQTDSVL